MSEPHRIVIERVPFGVASGTWFAARSRPALTTQDIEFVRAPDPELMERGNALISRALHTHNRDAWGRDAFEYIRDLLTHLEADHD